jgi:hypothetical protein
MHRRVVAFERPPSQIREGSSMTKRSLTMTMLALAALPAAAALAAPMNYSRSRQEARLVEAQRDLTAAAGTTKGAPQAELLQDRAKVDRLINDLRSGKHVDPKEIDQALWDAKTAP